MREIDADQELFAAAQRIAGVGTWAWFPETERVDWSDQTFDVFGLDPRSSTPSITLLRAVAHPDDREILDRELGRLDSVELGHAVDYRIVDRSGHLRHLRSTLVQRELHGGKLVRAAGCILDRTTERRAEREINAYLGVSDAIENWGRDDRGPETMLERVATAFDCMFATLWIPDGSTVAPRASWAAGFVGERDLLLLRHRIEFEAPDEVVLSARRDRAPKTAPARRDSALAMGRFAFPALAGEEVLAVCELQSREPIDLTERMTHTLVAIAYEIGTFLDHNRAELYPSDLTRREVEVLRLAADGLPGPRIADRLGISRSTVKTHFDHVYAKLDATDRASAVAKALRLGLFS